MSIKINNRRYLGNKYKLLPFIQEVVSNECKDIKTVFDVFSGTGAVASAFIDKTVYVNDILYSNHLAHLTWFSAEKIDKRKVVSKINDYNNLNDLPKKNYMSENFADTFFSKRVCLKIGEIREDIESLYKNGKLNNRERAILITSLLYAIDKIANTCGHYDAYRRGVEMPQDFYMEMPELYPKLSKKNCCFNVDSNELAKEITCDLAYLDPPYNSRQYCDAYHLLENIALWEKPNVKGVARKMDRTNRKSDYCTNKATIAFEDLIQNLNCKYILLSYNNTADKANDRSNAKLKDTDIMRILSKKGEVKVFSTKHKAFTAGKSENDDNEERLFLCTVYRPNEIIPSPLNYTGGKAKLLPQLLPLFPQNISSFVDLFCGGASVGINTKAALHYYNDSQRKLIGLLRTIESTKTEKFIQDVETLIKKYNLSDVASNGYEYYACNSSDGLGQYNKKGFELLRNDFNCMVPKSKLYYEMFFVLIVYSFNNQIRFNSKGEFNLPVGKRDFNAKMREKLVLFSEKLKQQKPIFTTKDFSEFDTEKLDQDSLVYCDPPYLITTASYNENGGWTEQDEYRLLEFLSELDSKGIKFALSNVLVHKGLKNEILANWISEHGYQAHHLNYNYKNSNYHGKNTDKETIEVLVTNY